MGKKDGKVWGESFGEGFKGFSKNNEWLKDLRAKILRDFENAHEQGKSERRDEE